MKFARQPIFRRQKRNLLLKKRKPAGNISYPASSAAVVFGGHLSAQAVFRLDRKSPAIRPCV
jgi:hypothetical protein